MKLVSQALQGVYEFEYSHFNDERGALAKPYHAGSLGEYGLKADFKELQTN